MESSSAKCRHYFQTWHVDADSPINLITNMQPWATFAIGCIWLHSIPFSLGTFWRCYDALATAGSCWISVHVSEVLQKPGHPPDSGQDTGTQWPQSMSDVESQSPVSWRLKSAKCRQSTYIKYRCGFGCLELYGGLAVEQWLLCGGYPILCGSRLRPQLRMRIFPSNTALPVLRQQIPSL